MCHCLPASNRSLYITSFFSMEAFRIFFLTLVLVNYHYVTFCSCVMDAFFSLVCLSILIRVGFVWFLNVFSFLLYLCSLWIALFWLFIVAFLLHGGDFPPILGDLWLSVLI